MLDPGFRTNATVTPPVPTSMELTPLSFDARVRGDDGALAACFTAPLAHGFSRDEVAPLALDALRDLGSRKLELRDVANGVIVDVGPGIRRIDAGRGATGTSATLVSDLGFTRTGDLVACVSGCSNDAACGTAVRAPRLSGDLAAAPPPGIALSALLGIVHHPEATAGSVVTAALVVSVLAVVFRRKVAFFGTRK